MRCARIHCQTSKHSSYFHARSRLLPTPVMLITLSVFSSCFCSFKVVHAAAAAMVVVLAMATVHVLVDGVVARVVRM